MLNILLVDDEFTERDGMKFSLKNSVSHLTWQKRKTAKKRLNTFSDIR